MRARPAAGADHGSRAGRLAVLLLALLLGAGAGARAAAPGGPAPGAVAVSFELAEIRGRTRLTLALSGPVEPSGFVLEKPDRAVVELPGANLQLPADPSRRRAGLVAGFRSGQFMTGRARIVMDLAAPASIARLDLVDGAVPGVKLLVVELARTDRDGFRRAAAASPLPDPETTGSLSLPGATRDRRPLVALDAGHGGVDPGATAANGTPEKDIVLAFTETLRDRLAASGRVRVMLTRDRDVFVPLDERVRRAREAGADLFVSVHADSIASPSVRGATIYTGAERATDAESAGLADRENAADEAGGHVAVAPASAISEILLELTLRETRGFSHRIARLLLADLGPVLRFSAQPHREAGFRVLRAPDLPSVLVELGYLSNARDTDLLLSDNWRSRTGAAMAGAIERFFGPRLVAERAAVSP